MCAFQTDHLSLFTLGTPDFDCANVTDVSTGQCNALVDLYNSTNGSGRTNKGGWLINTGVSTRSGVSAATGRVYQLLLRSNNLSGVLPSSLGNLTGLVRLYLSHNYLTGAIPTEIGNLR
jgi:hypothetical protein